MRPGIETVRAIFEDAKESGAGDITFACPDCEAEGRPDEEFTVFLHPLLHQPELVEDEPCEGLRVEFLADILNQDLPEEKKAFPPRYGITIRSLGFRTRELTRGAYRKKTAVVFCRNDFARVFNSFSLAVPADFDPADPATEAKPNNGNEMRAPEHFENESPEKNRSGARISVETNDLSHLAGTAGSVFQEYKEEEINSDLPEQTDTVSAVDYCRNDFTRIFNSFALPIPGEFISTISTTEAKPMSANEMRE
jgi:hypothetical protein